MRTLLVEDKKQLADAIKEYLKMHKIDAVEKNDGLEGYNEALSGLYDVIVLDLMLPSKDGLSIIKDLRQAKIDTPILVLTANVSTDEKVQCLLAGADDYVTKPFVLEELLVRLFVLTRRKSQYRSDEIRVGDIRLDKLNHTLMKDDAVHNLSMKEYQIMELLMDNTENIVEKNFILQRVWGKDADSYYNSVEVYISFLRKKLKALHSVCSIKSVRNVGYKLLIGVDDDKEEA